MEMQKEEEGRKPDLVVVELAKTNRSCCRKCKVMIDKGEPRVGCRYAIRGRTHQHWGYYWHHCRPDCHFIPRTDDEDVLSCPSFSALGEKEKGIVRKIYGQQHDNEMTEVALAPRTSRETTSEKKKNTKTSFNWTCPQCENHFLLQDDKENHPRITQAWWRLRCDNDQCRHVETHPIDGFEAQLSCKERTCLKKAQLVLHAKQVDVANACPIRECKKCGTSDVLAITLIRELTAKKQYDEALKAWLLKQTKQATFSSSSS